MKASKFIVLVGGILGILAFFLPMVSVHRGDARVTVSAFQVVKGIDELKVQVDDKEVQTALGSYGDSAQLSQSAKGELDSIKTIVLAVFAPALLLALIGGLGVRRKKLGRVAGTFALLAGLAGLGIAMLLKSAAEGDGGVGLTLLLVTGLAGVVGGLLTLVKPDRGAIRTPATA